MKRYISKSHVCINVALASGKNMHISFSPLTGGGSVYYAEDPQVQAALERHSRFNSLFRLDPYYVEKKEEEVTEFVESPEEENALRQVTVTCPDDAKDYLADKFGVSRTLIRSVAKIKAVALEHGIEFVGL
jgi:hypothetical protein